MHDLIIIGGGPAAICAGIYAARKKIKVLILTENFSGQAVLSPMVDNYPAMPGLSGMELMRKFVEHLKKFEIEIREGEKVENIAVIPAQAGIQVGFEIFTNKNKYQAKSVLIATGKSPRRLDVPGAKEFEGKGIVYCATCDAPLFEGKTVAVIGAGDSALYTAWDLTKYAEKIYILNKYEKFKSENLQMLDNISRNPKIEIIYNALTKKITGNKFVNGLIYELAAAKAGQANEEKELKIEGIFIAIGSTPNSHFAANAVKLNAKGEIIINCKNNQTSMPGIFAAGDVTDITEKQIIIAAGEGAKAALNVYEYLKK